MLSLFLTETSGSLAAECFAVFISLMLSRLCAVGLYDFRWRGGRELELVIGLCAAERSCGFTWAKRVKKLIRFPTRRVGWSVSYPWNIACPCTLTRKLPCSFLTGNLFALILFFGGQLWVGVKPLCSLTMKTFIFFVRFLLSWCFIRTWSSSFFLNLLTLERFLLPNRRVSFHSSKLLEANWWFVLLGCTFVSTHLSSSRLFSWIHLGSWPSLFLSDMTLFTRYTDLNQMWAGSLRVIYLQSEIFLLSFSTTVLLPSHLLATQQESLLSPLWCFLTRELLISPESALVLLTMKLPPRSSHRINLSSASSPYLMFTLTSNNRFH